MQNTRPRQFLRLLKDITFPSEGLSEEDVRTFFFQSISKIIEETYGTVYGVDWQVIINAFTGFYPDSTEEVLVRVENFLILLGRVQGIIEYERAKNKVEMSFEGLLEVFSRYNPADLDFATRIDHFGDIVAQTRDQSLVIAAGGTITIPDTSVAVEVTSNLSETESNIRVLGGISQVIAHLREQGVEQSAEGLFIAFQRFQPFEVDLQTRESLFFEVFDVMVSYQLMFDKLGDIVSFYARGRYDRIGAEEEAVAVETPVSKPNRQAPKSVEEFIHGIFQRAWRGDSSALKHAGKRRFASPETAKAGLGKQGRSRIGRPSIGWTADELASNMRLRGKSGDFDLETAAAFLGKNPDGQVIKRTRVEVPLQEGDLLTGELPAMAEAFHILVELLTGNDIERGTDEWISYVVYGLQTYGPELVTIVLTVLGVDEIWQYYAAALEYYQNATGSRNVPDFIPREEHFTYNPVPYIQEWVKTWYQLSRPEHVQYSRQYWRGVSKLLEVLMIGNARAFYPRADSKQNKEGEQKARFERLREMVEVTATSGRILWVLPTMQEKLVIRLYEEGVNPLVVRAVLGTGLGVSLASWTTPDAISYYPAQMRLSQRRIAGIRAGVLSSIQSRAGHANAREVAIQENLADLDNAYDILENALLNLDLIQTAISGGGTVEDAIQGVYPGIAAHELNIAGSRELGAIDQWRLACQLYDKSIGKKTAEATMNVLLEDETNFFRIFLARIDASGVGILNALDVLRELLPDDLRLKEMGGMESVRRLRLVALSGVAVSVEQRDNIVAWLRQRRAQHWMNAEVLEVVANYQTPEGSELPSRPLPLIDLLDDPDSVIFDDGALGLAPQGTRAWIELVSALHEGGQLHTFIRECFPSEQNIVLRSVLDQEEGWKDTLSSYIEKVKVPELIALVKELVAAGKINIKWDGVYNQERMLKFILACYITDRLVLLRQGSAIIVVQDVLIHNPFRLKITKVNGEAIIVERND